LIQPEPTSTMPSDKPNKIRLAIFGSGGGSNAEAIIQYFKNHPSIEVALIATNRKNAFILERAKKHNIPSLYLKKSSFYNQDETVLELQSLQIHWIILAGFLWLIPKKLIQAYPSKIINIHPALLPKYGGPGMYGKHVHTAVHAAKDSASGMSIHYVNENYDEGAIIAQFKTTLDAEDTPKDIAAKVLKLEHAHYASVIERTILDS